MFVTKQQIEAATETDLYEYLLRCHADAVRREGKTLHLVSDPSIKIKRGTQAAHDFGGTGKSWGSIKFLQEMFGYTFPEAVKELISFSSVPIYGFTEKTQDAAPEKAPTTYSVQRYLLGRGIEARVIDLLIFSGLLYQDTRGNCVFMNHKRDYAERRASNEIPMSDGKPFRRSWGNGFCWYMVIGSPKKGYICESAIDAISLAQIRKEDAYYISVGGASQKDRIAKVLEMPLEIVLAVDADPAGNMCREEHKELSAIIPNGGKDWNEILKKGETHGTITAGDAENTKRKD